MSDSEKTMTVGYSGTPLVKKLGIKPGAQVYVVEGPANYATLVAPLPEGVKMVTRATEATDIAHVFVVKRSELAKLLKELRAKLRSDAIVWVSWPKKAAKVSTDITEDTVREVALPLGFVDIKVCAVDNTWSGLKLMVRKELR
jgi:hypothetical protein